MADQRKDIPALAYLNAQVFQETDFTESIDRVALQYECPMDGFKIFNPAYVVSLMYCLIVIPKELLETKDRLPHCIASNEGIFNLFRDIKKDDKFDSDPVFHLLRHLRNSLAHADFTIADDGAFTFTDGCFEAIIDLDGLGKFLSSFGADLANLRDAK